MCDLQSAIILAMQYQKWFWTVLSDHVGLIVGYFIEFFFCVCVVLRLELKAFTSSHSTRSIFCDKIFQDRILQTICLGWL
jgi:hypothetical protein